jgi:chemotaxis protein CheZ
MDMPSGNGDRPAIAAPQRMAPKHKRQANQERRLFDELTTLARFIEAAKRDIAALHPDEIRQKHLPTATDELDAIVAATAEATGAILDAAEKLTTIGGAAGSDIGNQVTEQVTRIFEACTFQDITGQRITKVVKTLKQIEAKVADLVQAFGAAPQPQHQPAEPEVSGEAALLNGPQLPAAAASQSEIDAFFEKD